MLNYFKNGITDIIVQGSATITILYMPKPEPKRFNEKLITDEWCIGKVTHGVKCKWEKGKEVEWKEIKDHVVPRNWFKNEKVLTSRLVL